MLKKEVKKRNIPSLLNQELTIEDWDRTRTKIIKIFSDNVYGVMPAPTEKVEGEIKKEDKIAFAGKATHRNILLTFSTPKGEFSFPFDIIVPHKDEKVPIFIFLSFHTYKESYETPIEEILDSGYGLAIIHYETITEDNDNMQSGLSAMFSRKQEGNAYGKYCIWAYAMSRVMDYIQTLDYIDKDKIAAVGHSRLAKTSLWCGVQDTRFCAVFANNSGCSGAAITRGKKGETVKDICTRFSYWFCENYKKYMDNENKMSFDQHQLVAAMAPRLFYTCSASKDTWADPESEYLSCVLASEVYEKMGFKGLGGEDRFPIVGDVYNRGRIGYHMRYGEHFLSRYDWQKFIKFMDIHED